MAQFTKMAIVQAFVDLLNQKPLDKITVKEIVDTCGINRNTFYYHFEDMHALLVYILNAELEKVLADTYDTKSLEESFIRASEFALQNRRAIYHIYASVNRDDLERYLKSVAQEVLRRLVKGLDLKPGVKEDDIRLVVSFYRSGLVGMTTDWLNNGMKEDPEELIHHMSALLEGSVSAVLNRSADETKS